MPATDVLVIGDGIIGLSAGLELRRRGADVVVFGTHSAGAASNAAAGLLIPTLGSLPQRARRFFEGSLAAYPDFVDRLARFEPGLSIMEGVIERTDRGDVLHSSDGAIDNTRLMTALSRAVAADAGIRHVRESVTALRLESPTPSAVTSFGNVYAGRTVVLAAGAWSPALSGLPRPLPVVPLKGQMIALRGGDLSSAVMGSAVYLVPRDGNTVVGATVEHAGFDTSVSAESTRWLAESAGHLHSPLAGADVLRAWTGIRPATADMLPIIGSDPAVPALIYATGHSKNGILLAPATAEVVADVASGHAPRYDIAAFDIRRFA